MKLPTKTEEELLTSYGKDIREVLLHDPILERNDLAGVYLTGSAKGDVALLSKLALDAKVKCTCPCHTPGVHIDHFTECCDAGFVRTKS